MQYQEHFLESKSLSYFQELEADIFLQDKKILSTNLVTSFEILYVCCLETPVWFLALSEKFRNCWGKISYIVVDIVAIYFLIGFRQALRVYD